LLWIDWGALGPLTSSDSEDLRLRVERGPIYIIYSAL